MSGGWTPSVHLYSQSRGKLVWDEAREIYVPGESVQRERSAGACKGRFGLADGAQRRRGGGRGSGARGGLRRAGGAILSDRQCAAAPRRRRSATSARAAQTPRPLSISRTTFAPRTFASRCARASARSSTSSATRRPAWRPTRARPPTSTRSPSPPKRSGKPLPEVGLTTFRQPYTPVTFGAFAGASRGDLFDPIRRTPIHGWAERTGRGVRGRRLVEARLVFPQSRARTCTRRSRANASATRERVGLFDASTLGKIEVVGPDAAAFLERLYTNPLAQARSRALPLRPDAQRAGFHHGRRRHRPPRARPLPCDDDHRRRAARAASHGRLSADRVHRPQGLADFDLRAMGGRSPSRGRARATSSRRSSKASTSRAKPCRT